MLEVDVEMDRRHDEGLFLEHFLQGDYAVFEPLTNLDQRQVFDPFAFFHRDEGRGWEGGCRCNGVATERLRGTETPSSRKHYFEVISKVNRALPEACR